METENAHIERQLTKTCATDKDYISQVSKVPKESNSGSIFFPTKDNNTKKNTVYNLHIYANVSVLTAL
jgi:hypothetical protein